MAIGINTAQGRCESGAVLRHGHLWKTGYADPKSAKCERRRDQRRAARQRFYGLDRDPVPGGGREQNGRGATISGMEILGLDSAAEEARMRLIEIRRARLKFAVDIAEDLHWNTGRQRQHLPQEPAKSKKIRIIEMCIRDRSMTALRMIGMGVVDPT